MSFCVVLQPFLRLIRIWLELKQHSQPCYMMQAFRSELELLEREPASDLERIVATRSWVRYERQGVADDYLKLCASEDWVRLFIALRRAHSPHTRITPALLRGLEEEGRFLHFCHEEVLHCGDGGP